MIEHGIPKHDYFTIAQPPSVAKPTVRQLDPDYVKPTLQLKDPKSNEIVQAEIQDLWTFKLDELPKFNAFCLWAYGLEASKLVKVLRRRYPEIEQTQTVRFILLKKL